MPVRSLGKARCAWSCFSSSAAAHHWDFVCDGAEDVEDQVVDDEYGPWTNHHEAKNQLQQFLAREDGQ